MEIPETSFSLDEFVVGDQRNRSSVSEARY